MIAGLTRIVRDVGLAEDLAQDALVAALEQWPTAGIPDNPGAWLMATAKHRAIDRLHRNQMLDRKHEELGREMGEREMMVPDLAAAIRRSRRRRSSASHLYCVPSGAANRRPRGTYLAPAWWFSHRGNRARLLISEPTVAQRIVRAKRTLSDKNVPFEVPRGAELGTSCRQFWQSFT